MVLFELVELMRSISHVIKFMVFLMQEYHTYKVLHKFFEHHDDSVASFAYEKLLFLQGVLNHWCIDTESVPIAEDALVWITPAALPLLEHHRPDLSGCMMTKRILSLRTIKRIWSLRLTIMMNPNWFLLWQRQLQLLALLRILMMNQNILSSKFKQHRHWPVSA